MNVGELKSRIALSIALLLSGVCGCTEASITLQDATNPRSRLEQLISAINEPDPAAQNELLKDAFEDQSPTAIVERSDSIADIKVAFPGVAIEKVLQSTENQILAHCKAENGSIFEIYLELSDVDPCRIRNIEIEPVKTVVSKGEYKDLPKLPDTKLGVLISKLIETLNGKNESIIVQFVQDHSDLNPSDAAETAQQLAEFMSTRSALEFHSIRKYTTEKPDAPVVVIVRNNSADSWHAIVMDVSKRDRLNNIRIAPARAPKSAMSRPVISKQKAVDLVTKHLDQLKESKAFSGSILIAQGDEILVHRAMGLASVRYGIANKIDTKFNLASMNKMFTGVAICQLVESGTLSFNDTVDKYLSPDWLPRAVTSKIQLQHLLSHTSGIGAYLDEVTMNKGRDKYREVNDFRELFKREKLRFFEPGTNYRYSNTGMFLLGAVIEKASGQSYFDYVREHIFRPAGMDDTDSYPIDEPVPNLAMGYFRRAGQTINNVTTLYRGGPAGGGYSTTSDLYKFSRALTQNKLLSPSFTQLATTAKPKLNAPNYGFGFQVRPTDDTNVFGHSGGSDGISSRMDILPDNEFVTVVLSNKDEPAEDVAKAIRGIVAGVQE